MSYFDTIVAEVLRIEGSAFTNDPSDSGGETKYGITKGLARAYGYDGPMPELTKQEALRIYRDAFWAPYRLEEIAAFLPFTAAEWFEQAVVGGGPRAARNFQDGLNLFNNRGTQYDDIVVDGKIGPATLRAARAFHARRASEGDAVLATHMNSLECCFMADLARRREKDEKYYYGWVRRRVANIVNHPAMRNLT